MTAPVAQPPSRRKTGIFATEPTGPLFHYSDTWRLIMNTGSSIVTFLMAFLIQNTQNRDQLALQLKLDELILATRQADNAFAAIEELSDEALKAAKEDVRAPVAADPAERFA